MSSKSLRDQIAHRVPELRVDVGSVSFDLVRIPAGSFEIGSPANEYGHQPDESPVRNIRLSKAFYLGRYQITQAQYQAVMGVNPSTLRGATLAQNQVTFAKALEFCHRISTTAEIHVSLPTEAQWEYAARAGTRTPIYSGTSKRDLDTIGWYEENSGGAVHTVGLKQANQFGLYDMIGNIWELTADFLGPYQHIPDQDPRGELNRRGAMRGGGWDSSFEDARAARRLLSDPMFGGSGIRIAIEEQS